MTIQTLDTVLTAARQLAPRDRARLVARIVEEMVEPTAAVAPQPANNDAWEQMNKIRAEFATLQPVAGSPAEQLERDRRERDEMLMGQAGADVHA